MKKKEAIAYLKRKGEYNNDKPKKALTKEDKVKKVMKEGKIYGDPVAEIRW